MKPFLRYIPKADRPEIGRRLYEARLTPMTWLDAARAVLGRTDVDECQATTLAGLAREHAWKTGKAWPPIRMRWWEMPGAAERVATRRANRKAAKGERFQERRVALGISVPQFVENFTGLTVAQMEHIEREGPGDYRTDKVVSSVLDDLEYWARQPKQRDWLILTDQAA